MDQSSYMPVTPVLPGDMEGLRLPSYGTPGRTLALLLMEQFKIQAGIDMQQVSYRGMAPAYPDLITNRLAAIMDNPTGAAGQLSAGQLRAYAVTARAPLLPKVPTFAEEGINGVDIVVWYGLVAPPKLPRAIASRIQLEVESYVHSPEGRANLMARELTPVANTPDAFQAAVASEYATLRKIADRIGITPE